MIAARMRAPGGRSPTGESNRAGRCRTADDDQKGTTSIRTLGGVQQMDDDQKGTVTIGTLGGRQQMIVVSEDAVYEISHSLSGCDQGDLFGDHVGTPISRN
jgi:hypothetical protein